MQLPIDFQAAECRADAGMRRASARACRVVDPLWIETAIGFLAEHARTAGEFTIEQARIALQRGLIVRVGMARAASSNGSFKATYQAKQVAA